MTTPERRAEEYGAVSPYLIVDGADASIDFLQRVFDALALRRKPTESGRVRHAEVRIGDSVVMLADPVLPEWFAVPAHVHVYVADVDTTYRKAIEAGATPVQEPVSRSGEGRRGGVRDAAGTTWWIAMRTG